MSRKLLLGLNGLALVVTPILAITSCSTSNSAPNTGDIIFGGKEGTISELEAYFTQSQELKDRDTAAIKTLASLSDLKLNKELMKKRLFPTESEKNLDSKLVVKSMQDKFKVDGYAIDNQGALYNVEYKYFVNNNTSLSTNQLLADDLTFYNVKTNWLEEPVDINESWLTQLEIELDEKKVIAETLKDIKISGSFQEAQVRKLGLLRKNEKFGEFYTKEEDKNVVSAPIRLTEKGELFVLWNDIADNYRIQIKILQFHIKLGYEKIMDESKLSWSDSDKKENKILFDEFADNNSIQDKKQNFSTPLNIKNDVTSIITSMKLNDPSMTIVDFNKKTITEKLEALKITFKYKNIKASDIKDIVVVDNDNSWTATITWTDLLVSQIGADVYDEENNPTVVYTNLINKSKLFKGAFNKWNNVNVTSTTSTITV